MNYLSGNIMYLEDGRYSFSTLSNIPDKIKEITNDYMRTLAEVAKENNLEGISLELKFKNKK